jgi:hypothetical protein
MPLKVYKHHFLLVFLLLFEQGEQQQAKDSKIKNKNEEQDIYLMEELKKTQLVDNTSITLIEQELEYYRTLSKNMGNECRFNGLVIHQSVP